MLCVLVVVGAGCRSHKKEANPRSPEWILQRQSIPPYEVRGYTLEWVDTAGEYIYVSAQRVVKVKEGDSTYWALKGQVYAIHKNARGETLETLRSEAARAYPEREVYVAEKNVLLETADRLRLQTDYLVWEQGKDLMTARGWVRLETPEEVLRGEELEYNVKARTYRLRRLRGTIQSPVP